MKKTTRSNWTNGITHDKSTTHADAIRAALKKGRILSASDVTIARGIPAAQAGSELSRLATLNQAKRVARGLYTGVDDGGRN